MGRQSCRKENHGLVEPLYLDLTACFCLLSFLEQYILSVFLSVGY